jgi:hypothetical protein
VTPIPTWIRQCRHRLAVLQRILAGCGKAPMQCAKHHLHIGCTQCWMPRWFALHRTRPFGDAPTMPLSAETGGPGSAASAQIRLLAGRSGHAPDRVRQIVGDDQRAAVGVDRHADGPAAGLAVLADEARQHVERRS